MPLLHWMILLGGISNSLENNRSERNEYRCFGGRFVLALRVCVTRAHGTVIALVLILLCIWSPVVAGSQSALKKGMKGEHVQELQDILIGLGFL